MSSPRSTDASLARERLDQERRRLRRLIAARAGDVDDLRGADVEALEANEPAETARSITELQQQRGALDGLEHALAEVEAAIDRVEAGTYGIDEVTGQPIDPARLEALPTARTNVDTPAP